jgi:hypothetical protein
VIAPSALAGGMGWGIRGQYGHETGAMIAGLLVGLVLVLKFRPAASPLGAMRAAALCAAGIGFGGAMTYGQTIGLTQNPELIGNWAALGWGMLGLGIKGALWIGFAGTFLGIGLGGIKYRTAEIACMMGGMLALMLFGMWALNMPYDPAARIVPRVYFSSDWSWFPSAGPELKPRREFWGGFLFALTGLVLYTGWYRKDLLARRMAFWGCLGGIGFPLGQCIQAWHAWNKNLFQAGSLAEWDKVINWWNFMETTFGLVLGASLATGLWLNRQRIAPLNERREVALKPAGELGLFALHSALLALWEFGSITPLEAFGDLGISKSLIPIIGIAGGQYWPYLMTLPVIALPILGKTSAAMGYPPGNSVIGAVAFTLLPFLALAFLAIRMARNTRVRSGIRAGDQLSKVLLLITWLYFSLNYAFFKFPWPWRSWTARTPNGIIYTLCALSLTWIAIKHLKTNRGGDRS